MIWNHNILELGVGIFIAEGGFRRKHIAYNSLQWIWNYATNILNLHQLYAYVTEDNIPSCNLFEKAEYEKDCHFEELDKERQ